MTRVLLLAAAAAVLACTPAAAQTVEYLDGRGCDTANPRTGAIRGRVVADSTGEPVPSRGVGIVDRRCSVLTDSTGAFLVPGIAPGAHALRVASFYFRHLPDLPVVVRPGDTLDVGTLRLLPENAVADCLDDPVCAPLLRPDPASTRGLDDDERLREAALRTALALTGGPRAMGVACAPDDDPRVFAALAARHPGLAPASQCVLAGDTLSMDGLRHTPTGRPAFSVRVESMERSGDAATAHVGYYGGPLNGAGWECRLSREGQTWRPRWCGITWVS